MARARRSCLAVPGSSPKMIEKARSLRADEVFLDLEDAVAPDAKERAREAVVRALADGEWAASVRAVRVNGLATRWCHRDVIAVAEGAGAHVDCLIVPKVERAADVRFVDALLSQVEAQAGLERPIGLEIQIETARGLRNVHEIATASPRIETLIFGPADMSASLGLPLVAPGVPIPGYPGDAWHWVLVTILVAARAAGVQAVDGPYGPIRDLDGFRESALRARALGYDGKWVLHPDQIEVANEVFTPPQEEFDKAVAMIEAYEQATADGRGAATFQAEMIDEATRKQAATTVARGAAAGLVRSG